MQVSGIIDWDQIAYMPRVYELVRACSFMFQMQVDLSQTFISAYRESNPIALDELNDGAKAWGCFSDHHVWPLEEVYLNNNPTAKKFTPLKPFKPFLLQWQSVIEGLNP